ncbi:hypothetical protein ACLKA6_016694 [Drosophila palustris]
MPGPTDRPPGRQSQKNRPSFLEAYVNVSSSNGNSNSNSNKNDNDNSMRHRWQRFITCQQQHPALSSSDTPPSAKMGA